MEGAANYAALYFLILFIFSELIFVIDDKCLNIEESDAGIYGDKLQR
jgi:hypothetical protein